MLVVHAAAVRDLAQRLVDILAARGIEGHLRVVPDGEAAKTAAVAAEAVVGARRCRGFTRSDAVVGVGGGAVTDLAGFVAATWLRGVAVVQVPTTLLAMVDAAVGGKTGINTPEGKNLVGSFHEPAGVLVDLSSLRTLPRADLVAGMGEIVKGGFIGDDRIATSSRAIPTRHSTRTHRSCASSSWPRSPSRHGSSPLTCASPTCARSSTTGTPSPTPSSR